MASYHTGIVLGGPMAGQELAHPRPYYDVQQHVPLGKPLWPDYPVHEGLKTRIGRYEYVTGIWWWRGWQQDAPRPSSRDRA